MTHFYVCCDFFNTCDQWRSNLAAALRCAHLGGGMCASTHTYVLYDSFLCVPRRIPMYAKTHSPSRFIYFRRAHGPPSCFACVPWHIFMCARTQSLPQYIYSRRAHRLPRCLVCMPWRIHMCAMTTAPSQYIYFRRAHGSLSVSHLCHDSFTASMYLF